MNRHSLARNVAALTAMMISFTTFQGVVISLMPLSLAELGAGKAVIGGIISIPGIFAIMFGPPVARLGNTRFRKIMIGIGFLFCLTASWFFGRAGDAAGYIVPQALNGIANTMFWSLTLATSFQLIRGPKQHAIQSLITAAQGIGFFLGPIVSGYLSGSLGVNGFTLAVGASAVGLISSLFLSPSPGVEPLPRGPRELLGAYGRFFRIMTRNTNVVIGAGFVFTGMFLLYVMGGSFFLTYTHQIGLPILTAAAIISAREIATSLVRITFGLTVRKLRPIVLLGAGTVGAALCLAFLPLVGSAVGALILGVSVGVLLAFIPPAVNILSGASSAPEDQTFAIVGLNLSNFAAQSTMGPLLGLLLTLFGYSSVYPIVGVSWALLAGTLFVFSYRKLHPVSRRPTGVE